MVVGVDMIQGKPGLHERLELRANLRLQLPPHAGPKEKVQTGTDKTARKLSPAVHEIGDLARGKDRASFDQHEMEPHLQRGEPPGPFHRICHRPGSDHQAGGGQDASAMRFFDRLVYRNGETEVVAGDDKLSHDRPSSFGTRRPSPVRVNSAPRQVTVRVVKARSQETNAAMSRTGSSARLLTPSRSRYRGPSVAAAVASRTRSAAPRTVSPTPSPSRARAKNTAKGTALTNIVAKNPPGLAARVFWSQ